MSKSTRVIYLIVGIVFFIRAGQAITSYLNKNKPTATPTVAPTLAARAFTTYTSEGENQYSLEMPSDWQTYKIDNGIIFTPTEGAKPLGKSLSYFSITTKGLDTGPSTTLEEFRSWGEIDTEDTSDTSEKVGETNVGGHIAMMLNTTPSEGYQWAVNTWFMRGDLNYYITIQGTEEISAKDFTDFYHQIDTFHFAK